MNEPVPARLLLLVVLGLLAGCRTPPVPARTAAPLPAGETIIVAGQRFAAGTRVVTWKEPGGYDAYAAGIPLHGPRDTAPGKDARRGPTLTGLQRQVDRVVLHYDGAGLSRRCFEILRRRGLSAHFLLDVDGTVYQTLDLQERAWHAGTSNDRSIGIEIANLGAYPPDDTALLAAWYRPGPAGQTRLVPPAAAGDPRLRVPGYSGRPQRPDPVRGRVHGRELVQYDYTPEQYAALGRLLAALHRVFPRIALDCPRDRHGRPLMERLPLAREVDFRGVVGHFHLQENKVDPGPAFQWDAVLNAARRELSAGRRPDPP